LHQQATARALPDQAHKLVALRDLLNRLRTSRLELSEPIISRVAKRVYGRVFPFEPINESVVDQCFEQQVDPTALLKLDTFCKNLPRRPKGFFPRLDAITSRPSAALMP
jgi:hypothetical protein